MYVLLERRSKLTANLHLYVSRKARGKKAVMFIKEVNKYIKSVDDLKYTFNYTNDSRVRLFMGCFANAKRIGDRKGYSIYRTEVRS